MRVADLVLVPMAPSPLELDVTIGVFTEIESEGRDVGGPAAAVLRANC